MTAARVEVPGLSCFTRFTRPSRLAGRPRRSCASTSRSRGDLVGGQPFGAAGPYEKLSGRIYFAVDPTLPANRIVDRPRQGAAKRRRQGRVLLGLLPHQAEGHDARATAPCSTRCPIAAARACSASSTTRRAASIPASEAEMGDGFLMKQGFTLLWVGWQFDPPRPPGPGAGVSAGRHRQRTADPRPRAQRLRRHREGFDHSLADRDHVAYPVADPNDPANVMTVRDSVDGPRRDRAARSVGLREAVEGRAVADPTRVYMSAKFEPNKIYEVVYTSQNPPVVGLGPGRDPRRRLDAEVRASRRAGASLDPGWLDQSRARVRHLAERPLPPHLSLLRIQSRRGQPQGVRRRDRARRRRRPRQLQPSLRAAVARRPSVPELLLSDRHLPVHRCAGNGSARQASPTAC